MIKFIFGIIITMFYILTFAHEGHDMPGSLPPPPHGGRVGEAAHPEKHDHEHDDEDSDEHKNHEGEQKDDKHSDGEHKKDQEKEAPHEEAELFIEAKLDGTLLKIYPLSLEPKNNKVFKLLQPSSKLEIIELKIEMPRSKQSKVLKAKAENGLWTAEIGFVKDKRILVFTTLSQDNEKKTAKIQIER